MENENMDWCPVCEIVTTYIGEECATCGRLWGVDYSAADIEDRLRREKAERIAEAHHTALMVQLDDAGIQITTDLDTMTRRALVRATLAALTEKETAR